MVIIEQCGNSCRMRVINKLKGKSTAGLNAYTRNAPWSKSGGGGYRYTPNKYTKNAPWYKH